MASIGADITYIYDRQALHGAVGVVFEDEAFLTNGCSEIDDVSLSRECSEVSTKVILKRLYTSLNEVRKDMGSLVKEDDEVVGSVRIFSNSIA